MICNSTNDDRMFILFEETHRIALHPALQNIGAEKPARHERSRKTRTPGRNRRDIFINRNLERYEMASAAALIDR